MFEIGLKLVALGLELMVVCAALDGRARFTPVQWVAFGFLAAWLPVVVVPAIVGHP